MISLVCLAYFYGANTVKTKMLVTNTEVNVTTFIVNETVCVDYKTVIVEKPKYIIKNISQFIDYTEKQKSALKNLKPNLCNNIGCSEGFHKCKKEVLSITNIEGTKFNERPSTGWIDYDNRTMLPVQEDGFGQYLELNNSWYIWKGAEEYNLSDICFNNTWTKYYNRTKDGYYDVNRTFTFNNMNFSNTTKWMPSNQQTNQIYLRHV